MIYTKEEFKNNGDNERRNDNATARVTGLADVALQN